MNANPSDTSPDIDPIKQRPALTPNTPAVASEATVLALNSGSSSLKFGVYRVTPARIEQLLSGEAETTGHGEGSFHAIDAQKNPVDCGSSPAKTMPEVMQRISDLITASPLPRLDAIGHRIVHGGPQLRQPCLISQAVIRELKSVSAFAPLHTPASLEVIALATQHFPGLPQVACFDTGFHAQMPDVAHTLPVPKSLRDQGIRRYGFHGLSCESIVQQLGDHVPARLIIVHLGNGASVTAVEKGVSIDTSMGLTPTGGVVMSTRSGDLDPGVLVYLMREKKLDAAAIENLVDHQSGLLGISGLDSDMRRLHAAAATHADARLAVTMFCYSVRKQIVSMMAVLGGADTIVFTGGIGENDAAVRATICANLGWAGITLDDARNETHSNPVSDASAACEVRVLPSREDEQIARHTVAMRS
jgi:acetate kinase